jgi:hypothetical protein
MTMVKRKKNYVIYDNNGYIIIMSRSKRLAISYAKGKYNGNRS